MQVFNNLIPSNQIALFCESPNRKEIIEVSDGLKESNHLVDFL